VDFAFYGTAWDLCMVRFDEALAAALEGAGHRRVLLTERGADLILAHIDPQDPRPYHRPDSGVALVSLLRLPRPPQDLQTFAHAWLVRSLANLVIVVAGPEPSPETYVISLDRKLERVGAAAWSQRLFGQVVERIRLFDAQIIMDNIFDRDLEPELWQGGEGVGAMGRAARRLAELGVIASGVTMGEGLSHQDQRHLERIFQGNRISFGNLSQRQDAGRFWMSTSGVDWYHVELVGRDVELVKGYDAATRAMLISVPAGVRPRRVSPDALLHHLLYRAHPAVGAVVHLHAWLDGLTAVAPDYPRGSLERAQVVANLVAAQPDPDHAAVGIDRHGIVMTGEDLDEILTRLERAPLAPVPDGSGR